MCIQNQTNSFPSLPPKKIPLSEDQLVVSFLTGSYLVRFCSIHFFSFFFSHLEWGASINTWYLTRSENDNWKPSCGATVCQLPSRRSHWWLPCGFYFPQGNPQPGLTACQICWVPWTSSAENPYPSWWETVSNCAEHLCQLLFLGTPQASAHSAFRDGAPFFYLAFLPQNFSLVIW